MSQTDGHHGLPSLDEAPDVCEFNTCGSPAQRVVGFRDPDEFVCYCREHAIEQFALPGAKFEQRLRP